MGRFGEQLKALRTAKNMSQAELATALGVTSAYISALENGKKQPPPHALVIGLASILQVDESLLWESAKVEREDRLRARIEGIPTARKTSINSNEPSSAPTDVILKELYARFPNKKDRGKVLDLLRNLLLKE